MDTTQWIRSRATTEQPLNLHAVGRERPDLLEQAFALPTPRGWRKCLIDAGVDPYKIVHAYQENVSCAICGFSFSVLGTHLKVRHGVTGEEYLQEFGPNCELSSESFRATKFAAGPVAGIAHWEGIWSRHYVVDWIIRLHEEGHDVNYQNLIDIGSSLGNAGRELFGSWDAALQAAGLNPDNERAIPPFLHWTREAIIDGLNAFALAKKKDHLLQMPDDLRSAIARTFGTPKAACKAAGLRVDEINYRTDLSGRPVTKLVAAIRRLEPLKGRERRRMLGEIYHRNKINRSIIQFRFGSLEQLAAEKGIDPQVVSLVTYRDEADVHHDLDLLESAGLTLGFHSLRHGYWRLYRVIRDTGWGSERLKSKARTPVSLPASNSALNNTATE